MKALVLDKYGTALLGILKPGDEMVVEADLFPNNDVYEPHQAVLDYIAKEGAIFDLIVIGNNLGAGLSKAEQLPLDARANAIVVWNEDPMPATTAPYRRLGYIHFMSRRRLMKFLKDNSEMFRH